MLDEKILKILRNNTETYVSGEELCKLADISRSAIWKHMEKLREEGYDIEASPHLGYRLIKVPDALIPAEVRWKLKTKIFGKAVISYKKVDSTNNVAYGLAEKGIAEGTVIFADEQAHGKGRHGREWQSPPKSGVYMSCVLRPKMTPNEIPKITLVVAAAVAKSIRKITGLDAMIKWPNDILINHKKVCGILTEMKAEQDSIDFIVVGIGVNVNTKSKDLPKGASSLREESKDIGRSEELSRIDIAKGILESLEGEYCKMVDKGFKSIIEEWKSMTDMLGARVKITLPNRSFEAQVHTIDPDGSLVVRLESGVLQKISSGDIVMVR